MKDAFYEGEDVGLFWKSEAISQMTLRPALYYHTCLSRNLAAKEQHKAANCKFV